MSIKIQFRSAMILVSALIVAACLSGCGTPDGQNNVTWEFDGDGVRVFETFVNGEGDRRNFFSAASIEEVTASGHKVTVKTIDDTFEVFYFDEKQASALTAVLEEVMNRASEGHEPNHSKPAGT